MGGVDNAQEMHKILYSLEVNATVLLVGEPDGLLPRRLLRGLHAAGWTDDGHCLACTLAQPEDVLGVAKRVAADLQVRLGGGVGCCLPYERQESASTCIKYLLDETLLKEMLVDPLLMQYNVVVVDCESHSSMQSDVLLSLLKKVQQQRPDLKVLVSLSSLAEAQALERFFVSNTHARVCVLDIMPSRQPVETLYLTSATNNFLEATVDTLLKVHASEGSGDALIFVPGPDDIERAMRLVKESYDGYDLVLVALKGSKQQAFARAAIAIKQSRQRNSSGDGGGGRSVFLACHAGDCCGQGSHVLAGVAFVIDSGFCRLPHFDPSTGVDVLLCTEGAQDQAMLRAGLAGRSSKGKCFQLMPEEVFNALPATRVPEMQRMDISRAVLQLKALSIEDVVHFDFPSPPPAKLLMQALDLLHSLGALDDSGQLTNDGACMAEMPLDPRWARVLLTSLSLDCSLEAITVAAICTSGGSWWAPTHSSEPEETAKNRRDAMSDLTDPRGDHHTAVLVYSTYVTAASSGDVNQWCGANFVLGKRLARAKHVREQLEKLLTQLAGSDVDLEYSEVGSDVLTRCIAAGFFSHAVQLAPDGAYYTSLGRRRLCLGPSSILSHMQVTPEWVLYTAASQHSDECSMVHATVIDPKLLLDVAPHYYDTRTS